MDISMLLVLALAFFLRLTCTQTLPIDVREATISTLHTSLFSGVATCRSIVTAFIARMEAYNPMINAVIGLNPDALSIAHSLDESLSQGNATGLLFCIPILLKDNFDALPMPTTGGCLALNSSTPARDSPAV